MNRRNAKHAYMAFQASTELFQDAILYLSRRVVENSDEEARSELELLLRRAGPQHIPSPRHLRLLERSGTFTKASESFAYQIVQSYDDRDYGLLNPSWLLDKKIDAYKFVDSLGVERPKLLSGPRLWDRNMIEPGAVIKPNDKSSGHGCYIVYDANTIWDIGRGKYISSPRELDSDLLSVMHERGWDPERTYWISEELIIGDGSKPLDIKIFSFYGRVELIRVIERIPRIRTIHMDRHGNQVHPLPKGETPLATIPAHQEAVEIAETLSEQIPYPFMRIDFISSGEQVYFGEFTAWPGTFGRHTPEWDTKLGTAWKEAEARLMFDLIRGKDFIHFKNSTPYTLGELPDYPG